MATLPASLSSSRRSGGTGPAIAEGRQKSTLTENWTLRGAW